MPPYFKTIPTVFSNKVDFFLHRNREVYQQDCRLETLYGIWRRMISLNANIRRPRARWSGRKWNISNREGVNIHYRQKDWLAHPSQRQIDRSELEICGRPLLSRLTTGLLVGHDSNRHLKQILPPTLTDVQILFCKFRAGYRTYQHSMGCSILNFIKLANIRSPRFEHHRKTARIMHVNLQASFKLTTAFVPKS